jgi:hypothetical protein
MLLRTKLAPIFTRVEVTGAKLLPTCAKKKSSAREILGISARSVRNLSGVLISVQ